MSRRPDRVKRAWQARASWAMLALAIAAPAHAQEQHFTFDIAPQPLSSALLEFGRQSHLSVAASSDLLDGRMAPALKGDYSARQALEQLLAGSGLTFEFVQPNAVRILAADAAELTPGRAEFVDGEDRVTITGTNIRGVAPDSSPVEIYTASDIAGTGAVTTEQFIAKLPQNLGRTSQYAAGAMVDPNYDGVTSVDLRGLGVGTTLTLLNGHRMALSNSGQSADVSLIPAGAIERVEVLTDGASAIYGSDAIGGVVNFVLRKDFTGAETRLSYGGVTNGGMRQGGLSQTLGMGWGSGSGLVSYTYHSASALKREERPYSIASGPGTLTPYDERHNLLATLTQDVTDRLTVNLDLGGSQREVKNTGTILSAIRPVFSTRSNYGSSTSNWFANLGASYEINDGLSAELTASYAKVDVDGRLSVLFFNRTPQLTNSFDFSTRDSQLDIMGKLDGVLLSLPGGELRFSIGAGVLEEEFAGYSAITGGASDRVLGRRSPYAFAEVFAPLVSPQQEIPLVHRLEVSLAARYTDYRDNSQPALDRDFGNSTDPKAGLLWAPAKPLKLRATYGTSFRAPFLTQLDPDSGFHYLGVDTINGAPGSYLAMNGLAASDLRPETAKTYTWGFDYDPNTGFRLSGSYYNIDYTDRIGVAPAGGLDPFSTPLLLPDLIYRPPSAAFIAEQLRATPLLFNTTGVDPTDPAVAAAVLFALPNFWIYDTSYRNLAVSRTDGFDLSVSQSFEAEWGNIDLGANVTHVFAYKEKGSPNSALLTSVDVPGMPADWRARGYASLSRDGFSGTISVNYTDAYVNPSNPAAPQTVPSWTTVDLSLGYALGSGDRKGQGARISLSVQNLFDQSPPLLNTGARSGLISPIGFDPANANPLGRYVIAGVTYTW